MAFSPEYAHDHIIRAAPGCPPDILEQQVPLLVTAINYEGEEYQGVVETNQAIDAVIGEFFSRAFKMEFPIPDIAPASTEDFNDLRLQEANKAHSFNYRPIAGTNQLSLHSEGRALDLSQRGRRKGIHAGFGHPYMYRNAETGLWTSEPEETRWDPSRPGTLHTDHPLVRFMREKNMVWGGDWKDGNVVDYQHFGEGEW